MTVVKFRQRGPFSHLLPPPTCKVYTVLSYSTPEHYRCKGNAKTLLYISPFKTVFKLLQGKLDAAFCISMWIVTVLRAADLLQPNPAARMGGRAEPGDVPSCLPAEGGMHPTGSTGHVIAFSAVGCRSWQA